MDEWHDGLDVQIHVPRLALKQRLEDLRQVVCQHIVLVRVYKSIGQVVNRLRERGTSMHDGQSA